MFITFEGVEGSAKTTTAKAVYEKLVANGYKVMLTREPGGTPIAEQIRTILLDKNNTEMAPETEALLYAAARAQHWIEKIKPALDNGYIVLCDRWLGSSVAYQGWARALGPAKVVDINDFGIRGARPDLEFVLDVTPEEGFRRIAARGEKDRLENESIDFHNQVYDYFMNSEAERSYAVKINGSLTPDEIANDVYKRIIGHPSLNQ